MKTYYENVSKLKELRELSAPSKEYLEKVLEIIKDDVELALYFYDVLDPGWVELLDKAGDFEGLRGKETGMIGKYKAHYLKQCAESKAKAVLGIIEKLEAQDINIQGTLIGAIVRMPEETAVKGVELVTRSFDVREYKLWYGIGKVAAELMLKLVVSHPDEAFEIAEALLDAWVSKEKTYGKEIIAKFSKDEYSKLMMEHYNKVWETNPERAIKVLVTILSRCLETLDEDGKDKEGYDASISFGYGLELGDLNEIDMKHPSIRTVLVKGICEAGKVLIDKKPGKVSELLDLLEGTNRVIFLRIAMYLLRFVKPGTESARISHLIGNKDYFKEYNPCWNEHRRLLNDKFEDVSDEAKKAFLKWVDEDKYSKEMREEITGRCKNNNEPEPDFEREESRAKAEELYLVRERFKNEYEQYKKAAGEKNDSSLAPRKAVSETRFVSPEEGSTYSSEKMAKDSVESVITFLLEPKNYEGKDKVSGWGTAKDALAASFKTDVKKRSMEYLNVDVKKLERLDPEFLEKLFYGVSEAVRDGSFKKEGWSDLTEIAHEVVQRKHMEGGYKNCFSAILSTLRDGFTEKDNAIEFDNKTVGNLWFILATLLKYDEDYEISSYERDPIQMRCTSVNGEALEQVLMLGVVCKPDFKEYYEEHLKSEIRKLLDYVVRDVKRPEVNCTLGIDLGKIGWLDAEWLKENVEKVFEGEMWDVVWGTHVSWGRPSRPGFELLTAKGIYEDAIGKLGTTNKYDFRKDPEEGFAEHLMIGYFNEWLEFEDELLKKFFEKASAKLRGNAARFLTTGFKSVNEEGGEEKEKVAKRMKEYWEKRLEAMREKKEDNVEEAVEFTGWVEDTLLEPKETLELLKQTLELSEGKFGQMRDAEEFVEGVCELGKGNELIALRCIKKAVADENMREPWAIYEEPLIEFLDQISKLPNDYENVEDILNEAVEVADLYGRLQPDKFREIWEKLKRLRESKV